MGTLQERLCVDDCQCGGALLRVVTGCWRWGDGRGGGLGTRAGVTAVVSR